MKLAAGGWLNVAWGWCWECGVWRILCFVGLWNAEARLCLWIGPKMRGSGWKRMFELEM